MLAFLQYTQDYDEMLPHRQGTGTMVPIYSQLDPYVKNVQVRVCPSMAGKSYGYGFNWRHCGCDTPDMGWWGKNTTLAQYTAPAQTLVLGDTQNGAGGIGGADGTDPQDHIYCSVCYATPPYGCTNYRLASRHNDGFNGGFLDGHAKWYNTIQFIGLRTSGVEMWGHYTGG
jgi:prepilin-type processing-associated H-X9-DG protein